LDGDVLQHAKMLEVGGSGGMPPGNFFKIDAKILQFRDISTYIKCFYSACRYAATARVNGKVSVSSNNHMIHPLTISGNRHTGVQHRFIIADSFKRISGVWGLDPQKLCDFFNLRALKYPKIDAKNIKSNLYCTGPLDYSNFQQGFHGSPWTPLEYPVLTNAQK